MPSLGPRPRASQNQSPIPLLGSTGPTTVINPLPFEALLRKIPTGVPPAFHFREFSDRYSPRPHCPGNPDWAKTFLEMCPANIPPMWEVANRSNHRQHCWQAGKQLLATSCISPWGKPRNMRLRLSVEYTTQLWNVLLGQDLWDIGLSGKSQLQKSGLDGFL